MTAFPDVEVHDITDDDEFLVLACDGEYTQGLANVWFLQALTSVF